MIISLFAAFAFTSWLAMRIRPSMAQLEKGRAGRTPSRKSSTACSAGDPRDCSTARLAGYGFLVGLA